MNCPCGSTLTFDRCCGPVLAGEPAPTAEALMRSRYTAYVRVNLDHIMITHDSSTRGSVDRDLTEKWAKEADWQGLTIVSTDAGGPSDDEGVVEFIARYRAKDQDLTHHERSRFRKVDGRWLYVDGRVLKGAPVRAAPKQERNAPCACGSGKKYKRCHGAAA